MRSHLRVLLLSAAAALPLTISAHNLSDADAVVLSRVFALVYPDIVKAACENQNPALKQSAEDALMRSGLLNFSEEDVCADDICRSVSGADRVKLDTHTLRKMIDDFRKEQVLYQMGRSSQESEKSCKEMVERLERVEVRKARKLDDIILEVTGNSAE